MKNGSSSSMDRLIATYLIHASAAQIEARAQAIAVEQSVEMPLSAISSPRILDEVVGQVLSITSAGPEQFLVRIGLSLETTGFEIGQTMNMLFGNASILEGVRLIDAEFPESLLAAFRGPRFGIEGLRRLVQAEERPLTATAIKPQGSGPEDLARLCAAFARSGIDVIKDDHGLANQAGAPFARRVAACQKAVRDANQQTGHATLYAPNLSGGPRALAEQARIAKEEGVGMVMLTPMLQGLAATLELIEEQLDVPVLGHPAMAGASRIAPPLLIGKLFRLAGLDAVVFPNHGGRFSYSPDTCRDLAQASRAPWGDHRPSLPVPAGGMSPERVDEMIGFYGPDTMLLIGGALLEARDSLEEASRAFVERVAQARL
jgi:ribulose-bisphosphate carboxylase large chain